jgi:hypothetical protein
VGIVIVSAVGIIAAVLFLFGYGLYVEAGEAVAEASEAVRHVSFAGLAKLVAVSVPVIAVIVGCAVLAGKGKRPKRHKGA